MTPTIDEADLIELAQKQVELDRARQVRDRIKNEKDLNLVALRARNDHEGEVRGRIIGDIDQLLLGDELVDPRQVGPGFDQIEAAEASTLEAAATGKRLKAELEQAVENCQQLTGEINARVEAVCHQTRQRLEQAERAYRVADEADRAAYRELSEAQSNARIALRLAWKNGQPAQIPEQADVRQAAARWSQTNKARLEASPKLQAAAGDHAKAKEFAFEQIRQAANRASVAAEPAGV